jgi:hypothetical protein
VIRRGGDNGTYNLNEELANALLSRIARRWQNEVATKDFSHWSEEITKATVAVLDGIVADSPNGAKHAALKYKDNSLHMVENSLHTALCNATTTAQTTQKGLSRLIEHHLASHLFDAYEEADLCCGKDSVEGRKVCRSFSTCAVFAVTIENLPKQKIIHAFVKEYAPKIYNDGAVLLKNGLESLVGDAGQAVKVHLESLTRQVGHLVSNQVLFVTLLANLSSNRQCRCFGQKEPIQM